MHQLWEPIDMRAGRRWVVVGRNAVMASLLCMATVGWSATIAATVTRSGTDWTLTWTGISCNFVDFFNATTPPVSWSLTVNGVTAAAPLANSNFIGGPPDAGTVDLTAPNGVVTRGTIDGLTSFTCGTDTLTLPGHLAAPGAAAIPTLSEWALIVMGALMGVAVLAQVKAKSRANG